MKLNAIIPARIDPTSAYALGWNLAVDGTSAMASMVERAGYVLVTQAELDELRAAAQREAA